MKKNYTSVIEFENNVQHYLKEISEVGTLTREEEKAILKRIKDGDQEAVDILITKNLPFVVKLAKAYRGKGLSFSELIAEGNLGLVWSIQKYNFDYDTKFACHAQSWIRYYITEAIKAHNEHVGDCQEYQVVDITSPEVMDNDKLINMEYEENFISASAKSTSVQNLLDSLQETEREVLMYHFGLNGRKELNLKEIGKKLDIPTEKVRKIKDTALNQLKITCMLKNEEEFEELQIIS